MLTQILINGILLGGLYAIVGIGFSLVWGVMNLINIAHGAYIMLGAYTTFWLVASWGLDPFVTLPISFVALFGIAYVTQRFVINRVIDSSVFMVLILTFGLNLLLINVALQLWGGDYRAVSPSYAGSSLSVAGVSIPYIRVAVFVLGMAVTVALQQFMNKTRIGNAIRATALNRYSASIVGVNIQQIYAVTFGIGAGLAGIAGSLASTIFAVTPEMGQPFIGKAFVIACLGGLGNMTGAVVGGMILGLAETWGGFVLGSTYQQAIGFIILVLVLLLRPEGILGKKFYAEI